MTRIVFCISAPVAHECTSNAYAMRINQTEAALNNGSIPTLSVYCRVLGRVATTVF
jgi:hypothetical protein